MGEKRAGISKILLFLQFLVVGGSLGVSIYFILQLPTAENVLGIVCIVFTGYSLIVNAVGQLGIYCSSPKCLMSHAVLGILSLLGFAALTIVASCWLEEIQILPQVGHKVYPDQLVNETCLIIEAENANEANIPTLSNNVTIDDIADLKNFLEHHLDLCEMQRVFRSLITGRSDDTDGYTISTVLATAILSGIMFGFYLITMVLAVSIKRTIEIYS